MGAILSSLPRTVIAGVVITIAMIVIANIFIDMQTTTPGERLDGAVKELTN